MTNKLKEIRQLQQKKYEIYKKEKKKKLYSNCLINSAATFVSIPFI